MDATTELDEFCIPDILDFEDGPGGLKVIRVRNSFATARICLHGAHVIDYTPNGQSPVLWMSAHSAFADGEPIRGGIPICWPWFGDHPRNTDLPAHGFARRRRWQLVATKQLEDDQTEVVLELRDDEQTRAIWPHAFTLRYTIRVGQYLDCRLHMRNEGKAQVTITSALHSYFAISDIEEIRVRGLAGARYVDRLSGDAVRKQRGDVVFEGETDRIYRSDEICYCDDGGHTRCIVVAKEGSQSTVVWNPWIDKSARMPDFGDDEYTGMVCIETANNDHDPLTLEPGGEHETRCLIGIENYGFTIDELLS